MLLRRLAQSFRPALADLDRRLQDLQQGYVRGRDEPGDAGTLDEEAYRGGLLQVKWIVDGLSRSIVQLSRPGIDPQTAWFRVQDAGPAAAEVAELLDRAEHTLSRAREELRESFALIAASQASEQLTLARETADAAAANEAQTRRFETLVQYIAAAFLLPTLVAQVLGGLPAIYADCPSLRAVVLVGATIASAAVSVGALALYRNSRAKQSPTGSR